MTTLLIDIETYSETDLPSCGLYKYVEDDSFEVQLFAYSVDFSPAVIVDLASGEEIPSEILSSLYDPQVTKLAHNMAFELTCLSKHFGKDLLPEQWQDTMAFGAYLGLPLSLAQLGEVLRLDKQKLTEGKTLIHFFSKPYRGEKKNPADHPDKWEKYKAYCLRDVDTEVEVAKKIGWRIQIPAWERKMQLLDLAINKRGVGVDTKLAENAVSFWDRCSEALTERAKAITRLDNPNSVSQLKDWIRRFGLKVGESLDKAAIKELLERITLPQVVREVLEIRKELGKTSVKKYQAMINMACRDGRVRGLTQYYATVTGRFAGRGIQLQNLPQNHLPDLGYARSLVRDGFYEEMELGYDSIPDTLSQLIRTGFIPSEGNVFHICDFSAIEARVAAWLSGEEWVLDAFRNGEDIYCVTASRMFGVNVQKHNEHGHLRQPGKVAVLACGYGGGPGAFDSMAKNYGLKFTDDEKKRYVSQWRKANPKTVEMWSLLEGVVTSCLQTGQTYRISRGIEVSTRWGFLFVKLPSGRTISYPRAKAVETYMGKRITYERMNQTTKKWEVAETYGGKLLENITQAVARDILCHVMLRCEEKGHKIVFHVHDEVIVDSPADVSITEIEKIFSEPIPWAKGLPLKGSGYSGNYYYKD